ncbi:MAG: TonB C-terminal domain-containing protein [Deefgea sp.]
MNPNRSNYPDEQRGLAFVLAISMHALLAGFLLFSVQWKTKKPEPVVVELWGAPPPAPIASEQIEIAKPIKVPEPKPEPIPVPVKAPDIVTEKVKATAAPTAKPTAKPTMKPTIAPTAKPTVAPTAKPTAAPSAKPKTTAAPKKPEVKKPKTDSLEAALGMDALLGSTSTEKSSPNAKVGGKAGGTGDTVGATGGAGKGKGSGLGEAYALSIGQEIAQKAIYPGSSGKKPRVIYKIYLFPSGEIQRIELIEASSDPKWDKAIERAIQLYAPFPKPPNGASFNDYREVRWAFSPP